MKLTSQELRDGRMVDVASVCVCCCGERFPSDMQLRTHIHEPLGPNRDTR